jgi:TonB family protein
MKFVITLIFVFLNLYAFCQETILKKKGREIYYVLKTDENIKHGSYNYVIKKKIVVKGQYENNEKTGIWEFFNANDSLEQKYDYSNKKMIFNKNENDFENCKVVVNDEKTEIMPEVKPIFVGGMSSYERFISDNLKYPKEAKAKRIEGRQIVLILLSKDGEVKNSKIYRSISPDIDQEALRLISILPNNWIPAKHKNEFVDVVLSLPVMFRLN